jgi:signal transduction histidine kinase
VNAYALAPAVAAVLNFILAGWVRLRAPQGSVRFTFILWNLWLGLWNVGIAVGYELPNAAAATEWYKLVSALAVCYIAPSFLHFVFAFTDTGKSRADRWALRFAYGSAAVFTVMGFTGQSLLGRAVHFYWGFYPLAGRLEWLFGAVSLATLCYAFRRLFQTLNTSAGYKRSHVAFILGSATICFLSGFTNFLPLYGVSVYPLGNLVNSISSLVIAYAIVTYSLLDMRLLLRRSVLYGLWAGGLTGVYISLVGVFKLIWGHYGGVSDQVVYYTAAVPVTVVLAPLMKKRLEPLGQQGFAWSRHQYAQIVESFCHALLVATDLASTTTSILDTVLRWACRPYATLYAFSPDGELQAAAHRGTAGPSVISSQHPAIQRALSQKQPLLLEKALWKYRWPEEVLANFPFTVLVPLFAGEAPVGLIAFEEKRDQPAFSAEALALLETLAGPAAVALRNAQRICAHSPPPDRRAYSRTHQDAALLGLLATEMAHELTKPLTRILNEETRLEGIMPNTSRSSLRKIEREARRAAEILNGFSMLSPQFPLEKAPTDIGTLLAEIICALGLHEQGSIRIATDYSNAVDLPVHRSQMMQVLTNIIQNACEAMPEGGELRIGAARSLRPEGAMLEIAIQDSGPGIPVESQHHVYDPFFTTKRAQGGRGVGLTISRAMVQRHDGFMRIESPLTRQGGTRVIIELPLDPGRN